MDHWLAELRQDLLALRDAHLLRSLRPMQPDGPTVRTQDGRTLINLASNDYLALASHPHLIQAATHATQTHGTGAGASRLVAGTTPLHAAAEQRFATFKHAQGALLCPTGYMANLAVLTTLAAPGDLICLDKLNHASLIEAAFATGAQVRIFPHLNHDKLQRLLQREPSTDNDQPDDAPAPNSSKPSSLQASSPTHPQAPRRPRKFIVTDSIFSMDGDVADLLRICDLADRYDAIVIVDEAHGTGVLGETGAGLCELQNVTGRVDVVISTASKALGGLGGIVTARSEVIDTLINRAKPFIYTTAVPASQAATLMAALDIVHAEPERRQRVLAFAARLRGAVATLFPAPGSPAASVVTPIIPLIVGDAASALDLASYLESHGFFAPAIRPPTVPPQSARVRISLRADLTTSDIDRLITVLHTWKQTRAT